MALITGQEHRSGSVTDADGRQFIVDAAGVANSFGVTTTTAAPGAGATVATLTVVAGQVYKVRAILALTGTAETQLVNMTLRQNAATVSILPSLSGQVVIIEAPRVLAAGTTISVTATAAATPGSVYTVHLMLTRIE